MRPATATWQSADERAVSEIMGVTMLLAMVIWALLRGFIFCPQMAFECTPFGIGGVMVGFFGLLRPGELTGPMRLCGLVPPTLMIS